MTLYAKIFLEVVVVNNRGISVIYVIKVTSNSRTNYKTNNYGDGA